MMEGNAAEAGFMSAMLAVLVVCMGSMFLIQAIPDAKLSEDSPDVEDLWALVDAAVVSGERPDIKELSMILEAMVDQKGVNGVSLELRPALPLMERKTINAGMMEGLRDSSVRTILFAEEGGERIPYFLTLAVWIDV